jgi:outer membrane protease
MDNISNIYMTDRDWIDKGKADAWDGKGKHPPEHDPQSASMYDLGYCEGEIGRSPLQSKKQNLVSEDRA